MTYIRHITLFLFVCLMVFTTIKGFSYMMDLEEVELVETKEGKEIGEESEIEKEHHFDSGPSTHAQGSSSLLFLHSSILCENKQLIALPGRCLYLMFRSLLFYH